MLIVEMMHSKLDRNGNSYHALRVINKRTQKSATATVSGNNVSASLFRLFGDWEQSQKFSHSIDQTYGVREFDRRVKGEPHAGCTPEEIAAWIVSAVGPIEGAKL